MAGVVIVGAGMAGAELAIALRRLEYPDPITVVGEEPHLPYQRPPLSKAYLGPGGQGSVPAIRPSEFYAEREIELHLEARATSIDRERRTVTLADGRRLRYDELVLATGSRNRHLELGVERTFDLRTLDDANQLAAELTKDAQVAIIGGGFIGLELAAAARKRAAEVTVIEALDRLLSRVASPILSDFLRAEHEGHGVEIRLRQAGVAVEGEEMVLANGERLRPTLVVVGVGAIPNVGLAETAGLAVDGGIVVDDQLRTSDPAISAIGDCARFPCAVTGSALRLESVQNATDQARYVAARLTGEIGPYLAVPWFWTEQFEHRVQIAGVAPSGSDDVVRDYGEAGRFSVCRFVDDRMVAVESVGRARDHVAARKLLAPGGPALAPSEVTDPAIDLAA